MVMEKLRVDSLQVQGKRVFIRADFNVPLDKQGNITDDTRIQETLPTIRFVREQGGMVVLASHLGRPKGKIKPELTLKPVARRLGEMLGQQVRLAPDCIGPEVESLVKALKPSQTILLENLRFHPGEEADDEGFAGALAKLAELYVNDAFGAAHRAHASVHRLAELFDQRAAGFLLAKEIKFLSQILSAPERPLVALLGGAKVSTKIAAIKSLLNIVDDLLIGGGMTYTFVKAQGGKIGNSICEDDFLEVARETLELARSSGRSLHLASDCVAADRIDEDAHTQIVSVDEIPDQWEGVDVGPQTLARFSEILGQGRTIFWNGPVGIFEVDKFAQGTRKLGELIASLEQATSVVGGGDTLTAINKFGLGGKYTHVSTGGGASLEFLEGRSLPGIEVLPDK